MTRRLSQQERFRLARARRAALAAQERARISRNSRRRAQARPFIRYSATNFGRNIWEVSQPGSVLYTPYTGQHPINYRYYRFDRAHQPRDSPWGSNRY